jgi:hypothetical protein
MLAALVLGLKRQSGRWPETCHRVIMEYFCPRTIFLIQFGIPTQACLEGAFRTERFQN